MNIEGIARGEEGVIVSIGEHTGFDGHVGTEEDLGDVVEEFDGVGIHCGEGLHDGGTEDDEGDVDEGDGDGATEVAEPPVLR